jgi:hypothetical protein
MGTVMDKHHILHEIRRTAEANGGVPLGSVRFRASTQIKEADWFGKYWRSWGEALVEAGFPPNEMQSAYDEDALLKALIDLTREIGVFPVKANLMLKRKRNPSFPSHNVLRRFGSKAQCVSRLLEYCRGHAGLDDVAAILAKIPSRRSPPVEESASRIASGYVYLVKHGSRREYKIGATDNPLRRHGEVAFELPEKVTPVHTIETDDPYGVERYWHHRFREKHKNGEWYQLNAEDVRAFRRWRRIF